jgi:hypothetical protein
MAAPKYDKADLERRMKGAVESLKGDLSGLRTPRCSIPSRWKSMAATCRSTPAPRWPRPNRAC